MACGFRLCGQRASDALGRGSPSIASLMGDPRSLRTFSSSTAPSTSRPARSSRRQGREPLSRSEAWRPLFGDAELERLASMIREVPGGMPYGKRSESGTMGVLDPHESELFQVVRDGGLTMLPDPEYRRPKPKTVKPFDTIIHGTRSARSPVEAGASDRRSMFSAPSLWEAPACRLGVSQIPCCEGDWIVGNRYSTPLGGPRREEPRVAIAPRFAAR